MRAMVMMVVVAVVASLSCVIPPRGIDQGDPVHQAQAVFMELSVSLFNDIRPPDATLINLIGYLDGGCDSLERLRRQGQHPGPYAELRKAGIQTLRAASHHLGTVQGLNIPVDSVRSLFRDAFYAFHNLYGDELLQEALRSEKRKLLLFSASVTCDCMRRLCDAYTADIAWLQREMDEFPEVVIIDCIEQPLLMSGYAIDTIPTVVLLDVENREYARMRGEDRIIASLAESLLGKRGD